MRTSSISGRGYTVQSASLFGPLAPALCVVHCLGAPLLTAVAPTLVEAPALEWGLYAVSAAAVAAMVRRHASARYVMLALGALAVWALALAGRLTSLPAEWVITAASLTTAGALMGNLRELRRQGGLSATGCTLGASGCAERLR